MSRPATRSYIISIVCSSSSCAASVGSLNKRNLGSVLRGIAALGASEGHRGTPGPTRNRALARLLLRLDGGKDAVGFGTPVRTAGEGRGASRSEQALVGEIGDEGLPFGSALRRPWRQPDLAHGFR